MFIRPVFSSVLCPIFVTEVLADLSKPAKDGRPAQRVVEALAEKAPCLHSYPNVFHKDLIHAELLNGAIDMTGRPHVGGGHYAKSPKGLHIAHDEPPEMVAFSRWQNGQFEEIERDFASSWRASVAQIDLKSIASSLRNAREKFGPIRNLADARASAASLVDVPDSQWAILKTVCGSANLGNSAIEKVKSRWAKAGRPPIRKFAPYSTFVLEVDVFFELALMQSMIGDSRPSNRIDISYLYYLPFCQMFISRDRLHERTAPLFLDRKQQFVWGDELKSNLASVHDELMQLPIEVRETGLMKFAKHPPKEGSGTIASLWDHFLPRWRDAKPTMPLTPNKEAELLAELKKGAR